MLYLSVLVAPKCYPASYLEANHLEQFPFEYMKDQFSFCSIIKININEKLPIKIIKVILVNYNFYLKE